MDKNLESGTESVDHIAATIAKLRQQLDEINIHTDSILAESGKLTEIGQENADSYAHLQTEIMAASKV